MCNAIYGNWKFYYYYTCNYLCTGDYENKETLKYNTKRYKNEDKI